MDEKILLEWETLEYIHTPKTTDWFWTVSLVMGAMAVASIIFSNLLFAIFILLAGFMIMVHGAKIPRLLSCHISTKGVQIDNSFYAIDTLASFWVDTEMQPPRLVLKSKKAIIPHIHIPIGEVNPSAFRETLRPIMKEERHEPSLMEALGELIEHYL